MDMTEYEVILLLFYRSALILDFNLNLTLMTTDDINRNYINMIILNTHADFIVLHNMIMTGIIPDHLA